MAITLTILALLAGSIFQTTEYDSLRQFSETMAAGETTPISNEGRQALYGELDILFVGASDSVESVFLEEGNKLDSLLDQKMLELEELHKQRVRVGKLRINKKNLSPKTKRIKIHKLRKKSQQRLLREQNAAVESFQESASLLEESYAAAEAEVRFLHERASQSIAIRPSEEPATAPNQ